MMTRSPQSQPAATVRDVPPYTRLAPVYDAVMAHVDYAHWAAYAHGRLQRHHPDPQTLLELGCGTGALAVELQPLGGYDYRATDASADMLAVARATAEERDVPVRFAEMDFTALAVDERFDAVVLLYDGLNYLQEPPALQALFRGAHDALRPGGVFLFDQSTPVNSINNAQLFDDAGEVDGIAYERRSAYDPATRTHVTTFELTVDGRTYRERHVQRAYTPDEIRAQLRATPFEQVAAYDNFSTAPATDASERIHWVVRRPR
jgi:SAM-dependent methyltransferase